MIDIARAPEPRINGRIRAREVRVIGPKGEQHGIKPLAEALVLAEDQGLDLVEVADNANPSVCKIMDFGKFKYEAAQRAKESRKKANNVVVKEMKYRPKIGVGDFETKTRKVEGFLNDGNKVKITIMFRGREVTHPELGRKLLDQIIERVEEYALVESYPRLEGRNMTTVLAPLGKKQKKKKPKSKVQKPSPEAKPADPKPENSAGESPTVENSTEK